jgi:hypothetical protein
MSLPIKASPERIYRPDEIAHEYGLHVETVRRLFFYEPGVIRVGHPTLNNKHRHYKLRVPESVVKRVFAARTVGNRETAA